MKRLFSTAFGIAVLFASPVAAAIAQTPRDALLEASFVDLDKAAALNRVTAVQHATAVTLRKTPGDWEAALIQTTAISYRAKLTGSRQEALAARVQFEALVKRDPRSAEAHLGLGAWHVGAVHALGRLMGRAALGAQKDVGFASLDRAVALGGGHATFAGLAGLLRLELDIDDARGRALAETATHAVASARFDRIMQRACAAVLVPLRAGDTNQARKLVAKLLPFGQLPK